MNLFRILGFCLLALLTPAHSSAAHTHFRSTGPILIHNYHSESAGDSGPVKRKGSGVGIREVVPQAIKQRYAKWKEELLSTEFGRTQWDYYANNKHFLLMIVVSEKRKYGAGTDGFEWNKDGELVAATITLGKNLDKGYPDPVYYPVMNSLATYDDLYEVSGDILASAKLVHEIGHVIFTAQANGSIFQRQNKLMASYNTIFLKNGYDTSDPRLIELANELGGKPVEIWEAREYKSELSALRYLMERIHREPYYCTVFTRVKRNVTNYAFNYRQSFEDAAGESSSDACRD